MCGHGLIFNKSMVLFYKHLLTLQARVAFSWFGTQTLSANRRMECALRNRSRIEKGKSLGCHVVLTWSSFKVNSDQSFSSATVGIVTTDIIKLAHCFPLCTVYTACRDVAIWKSPENPSLNEQETWVHDESSSRQEFKLISISWPHVSSWFLLSDICVLSFIFCLFKETCF